MCFEPFHLYVPREEILLRADPTAAFSLNGKMDGGNAVMWATNPDNGLAMKATVSFSE